MDPIESINTSKDSSFAMLLAAQKKGWSLYYMQQADIYLSDATAMASAQQIEVNDNPENWYQAQEPADIKLSSSLMMSKTATPR